ncbi:MAG TPA: SlyX family protein [Gammaproteobacteria bacterium]|nr:SlyX family protein [Gammaproteobacteria bacterium]
MEEQKMQETITDLQIRLVFQENSLETINLTVVRQQSEIEVMKREIVRLKELVEDIRESRGSEDGAVELPPHY